MGYRAEIAVHQLCTFQHFPVPTVVPIKTRFVRAHFEHRHKMLTPFYIVNRVCVCVDPF